MASSDSSIMSRWCMGSMPIMKASDGSAPGADAEHDPAPGQVVEQDHAVGQDERVVVGERAHARAQADVPGPLRCHGDEHLGRGDDLVARRVVLAEPRLVEAQLVEPHHQLEVAFERQGGVLPHGVERSKEDAEVQGPVHGRAVYGRCCGRGRAEGCARARSRSRRRRPWARRHHRAYRIRYIPSLLWQGRSRQPVGRPGESAVARRPAPSRGAEAFARYERARTSIMVGSAVRAARRRAEVSQVELADRAGMTQPSIARLEKGHVSPTVMTLDRIARALGTELVDRFRSAWRRPPDGRLASRRRALRPSAGECPTGERGTLWCLDAAAERRRCCTTVAGCARSPLVWCSPS